MKIELQGDIWESLFPHAFTLMEEVRKHGGIEPFWTFGGGTVLMLRYRHRFSRDIDLFVPDPQYLGFVTPRLSETAEGITSDYVEQGELREAGPRRRRSRRRGLAQPDRRAIRDLGDHGAASQSGDCSRNRCQEALPSGQPRHRTGSLRPCRRGRARTNSPRACRAVSAEACSMPSCAKSRRARRSCASSSPGSGGSASTEALMSVSRWRGIFSIRCRKRMMLRRGRGNDIARKG